MNTTYMKANKQKLSTSHKQSGFATILIVLLVAIAMTALSMNLVHNVKSTQHKQIAVHATSHVQPLAWTGVEVFRGYLTNLEKDEIESLQSNKKIKMSLSNIKDTNVFITATLVNAPQLVIDGDFEYFVVSAVISALDHTASASSTLQAVYHVAPSGGANCTDCTTLNATLDFHDDLDINGGITVKAPAGESATFNVDGNVNAINISLSSINVLNSTKDIRIGSGTFIDELYANGDIFIEGSASVFKASALGSIDMGGNTSSQELRANGDITLDGIAEAVASLESLGSIFNNSVANQGAATAGGDIFASTGGSFLSTSAVGNIDISSNYFTIPTVRAQGDVACPGPSWEKFDSIKAQGNAINCPSSQRRRSGSRSVIDQSAVTINLMQPLTAFDMPKPIVDVWQLKNYANYLFTLEGDTIKVLVKNINGIDDGNYYLADYPNTTREYRDYLCEEIDAKGMCSNPASPSEARTICYGHTPNDDCLNFSTTNDRWEFNGKSFAPGVMWFEGDLKLGNGTYFNTFLATGDILTLEALKTQAPNYAGFGTICDINYPSNKNVTGDFDGLFPTNLCDMSTSQMIYNSIGNIALAAGGTPPGASQYEGGDISLGASNDMGGTILAGEHLITGGSTTVRGYVAATSQSGTSGEIENEIGGSTNILLDDLPAGYNPEKIPPMETPDPDDDSAGGKGASKLIWARFL